MPVHLGWQEVTVRLVFTVIAGLVIGLNRGGHGRPAGMRTTLLVCLAASLSMIQANLLMDTVGKGSDSFVVLDLMRLPLGILSGMGFIGAGAILRKDNLVLGVTTAATLWFTTMMGLCMGGGQLALGTAACALGLGTLWGLKYVEQCIRQDARGALSILVLKDGPTDAEIRLRIEQEKCRVISWGIAYAEEGKRIIRCDVQQRVLPEETWPPKFVRELAAEAKVEKVKWQPQGLSDETGGQTPPKGMPISISEPEKN